MGNPCPIRGFQIWSPLFFQSPCPMRELQIWSPLFLLRGRPWPIKRLQIWRPLFLQRGSPCPIRGLQLWDPLFLQGVAQRGGVWYDSARCLCSPSPQPAVPLPLSGPQPTATPLPLFPLFFPSFVFIVGLYSLLLILSVNILKDEIAMTRRGGEEGGVVRRGEG